MKEDYNLTRNVSLTMDLKFKSFQECKCMINNGMFYLEVNTTIFKMCAYTKIHINQLNVCNEELNDFMNHLEAIMRHAYISVTLTSTYIGTISPFLTVKPTGEY